MTDRKKRDIHNLKRRFETASINLQNDKIIIQQNKELILKFIRDCRLGKTVKNRQKKVIGEGRCLIYLQQLKRMSFWLNKQFDKVEQVDIEKIIENLNNDKYLSRTKNKNPNRVKQKLLSHSTKVGYKKTLRKFYKWCLGNNTHYPELVDWIDTYDEMKEIPALTRAETENIADASKIRDKAIIMFLFDSGARAEELLNIKILDLTIDDDIYKVRIVFSKTKRRTIHLPICSKFLAHWLKEYQPKSDDNFLFPIEYDSLRKLLRQLGKKILNKRVTPHIMRHSSVTYYASLIVIEYTELDDQPPSAPVNIGISGDVGEHPTITWDLNAELDVKEYKVFRKRSAQDPGYINIATLNGQSYEDTDVTIVTKRANDPQAVYYKIKAVDDHDQLSPYSYRVQVLGQGGSPSQKLLADNTLIPENYGLSANYPNPFNPTHIEYSLPERSSVSITVHNFEGREVTRLVDEIQSASFKSIRWNGVDSKGQPVASGVYFYKIEAKSLESDKTFSKNMKMTLLK